MAKITLKEALATIGPRVGKDPVTNRTELIYILDRAQEAAYNKGTWWGMFKELNITTDGSEIKLPYPYTNLIAVNINGRPKIKRGMKYQFHQNGYGSIRDCYEKTRGARWSESVIDGGEVAVPWQPRGHALHVRCRTKEKANTSITIQGLDEDGSVYTYFYDEAEAKAKGVIGKPLGDCKICSTTDESDRINHTKVVWGEVVPLEGNDVIIETNTRFHTIDSITKDPTLGPVDIFVSFGGEAQHLLTMEPEQTESSFRRWHIPDNCSELQCVHVLAKLGEPAPLAHDGQVLMIKSRMALLYLAMYAHHEFDKMEPQLAELYLARGLQALDEQNEQNTGHTVNPIQVITPEIEANNHYGFK